MLDDRKHGKSSGGVNISDDADTLSLDALTELLRVVGPPQLVKVKGIARELNWWTKPGDTDPTRLYGRLEQGSSTIRFEIPPQNGINDGDAVVLQGALRIRPTKEFRTTHEVLLTGDVVGNWEPRRQVRDVMARLERVRPRVALASHVAEFGIESVAFLTTDTAWQDLLSAAKPIADDLRRCHRMPTSFVNAEQFQKDVAAVRAIPDVKAIVIARGGTGTETVDESDAVVAALIATELPFYAALGHDKHVHLMDRYADGTYPTPSIIGTELAHATAQRWEAEQQELREQELTQENEALLTEVAGLRRELANANQTPQIIEDPGTAQPSSTWVKVIHFASGGFFVIAIFFLLSHCSK